MFLCFCVSVFTSRRGGELTGQRVNRSPEWLKNAAVRRGTAAQYTASATASRGRVGGLSGGGRELRVGRVLSDCSFRSSATYNGYSRVQSPKEGVAKAHQHVKSTSVFHAHHWAQDARFDGVRRGSIDGDVLLKCTTVALSALEPSRSVVVKKEKRVHSTVAVVESILFNLCQPLDLQYTVPVPVPDPAPVLVLVTIHTHMYIRIYIHRHISFCISSTLS